VAWAIAGGQLGRGEGVATQPVPQFSDLRSQAGQQMLQQVDVLLHGLEFLCRVSIRF
jgi:hypothetical protein